MQIEAHAKINWALRVTGRRDDGFHDLETLFQEISLHDTLTIERAERFLFTCDDPTIPTDERNLVVRAARALQTPPVAIHLQKRIPAGGGLGGGSSDAAATLVALSKMFSIDAPLESIALQLGSDVPFFLHGGTAYATGRGEVLTPMPSPRDIPMMLLLPEHRVLTAQAFRMLRTFSPPLGIERYREMLANDFLGGELVNDFEEPVFATYPALRDLLARLRDAGAALARMSGSGSTLFAAFNDVATRDAAMAKFADVRCVAVAPLSARG